VKVVKIIPPQWLTMKERKLAESLFMNVTITILFFFISVLKYIPLQIHAR